VKGSEENLKKEKDMEKTGMKWVVASAVLAAGMVQAAVYTGASGGNWNEPGNWNPSGVPSGVRADINSSKLVIVDTAISENPAGVRVGDTTEGSLTISTGGALTSTAVINVGRESSGTSKLTMNGGSLITTAANALTIGVNTGTGEFHLNSGTVSVGGGLVIGQADTAGYGTGLMKISGSAGSMNVGATLQINQKGSILWDFDGGKTLSTMNVNALNRSGSSIGTYDVDFANFSGTNGSYTIKLFDITSGSAVANGFKDLITTLNTSGKVTNVVFSSTYTANGSPMAINMDFTAIPEPATVGLFVISGVFLMFIRKHLNQ